MNKFKNLSVTLLIATAFLAVGCNGSQTSGVMKTANGGVDWQFANKLNKPEGGSIANLNISKLEYSPTDSSVFYAGAFNSGLYKSVDGAENWEEVLSAIPVYDFALHPFDPNIILVAGLYTEKGRVLITKDGGKSWNEIFSDANSGVAVRSVAINPSNPDEILIGSDTGSIIKSSDGGVSWKLVQNYNSKINNIYWNFDGLYIVIGSSGVYKSTDSGETFQIITNSLVVPNAGTTLAIFGNAIGSYNQMTFSKFNSSTFYISTSNGIFRTDSGGSSWQFVGLPLAENAISPEAIALSPTSDNVLYVSAGSIIYKSSDSGASWTVADTKSGYRVSSLLVNSSLPQVAYAGLSTTN